MKTFIIFLFLFIFTLSKEKEKAEEQISDAELAELLKDPKYASIASELKDLDMKGKTI
jgi:hypothetical protein